MSIWHSKNSRFATTLHAEPDKSLAISTTYQQFYETECHGHRHGVGRNLGWGWNLRMDQSALDSEELSEQVSIGTRCCRHENHQRATNLLRVRPRSL
jgi:hypothetical protein